jgi:hypothetical protein
MTAIFSEKTSNEYYSYTNWQDDFEDYKKYKSFVFFENLGKSFNLPDGFFVQLGVGSGHTLQEMKQHRGDDRVLGIDLYNPNHDPNVYCVDIKKLKIKLPCAYIENDIGDSSSMYGKTDRWAATQWGISCLVKGGIMITSADHMIGHPVKSYAEQHGCQVVIMSNLDHELWAQYLNSTIWKTQGWFIITKN